MGLSLCPEQCSSGLHRPTSIPRTWIREGLGRTAPMNPSTERFRDECLSMEWFRNRIDAKITIEQFRRQHNEIRPHSSFGQLIPVEFKQKLSLTNNPNAGHFLSDQRTEECRQVRPTKKLISRLPSLPDEDMS
jgi:Integrase core domain